MLRFRIAAVSTAVLIIALALSGCGGHATIAYIPDGSTYATEDLESVAMAVDLSVLEDVTPDLIPETRQEYLTDLRSHGDEAGLVADTLTRDFPLDTLAVPLLVESATVEDQEVWLVVEAWAEEGSSLSHRRLWLLDRDTLILVDSLSFR